MRIVGKELSIVVVVDLRLELRVGVLTDAKNNEVRETRGFRQVRASLRIKTLCATCIGVL
jgi:hypothetical protein